MSDWLLLCLVLVINWSIIISSQNCLHQQSRAQMSLKSSGGQRKYEARLVVEDSTACFHHCFVTVCCIGADPSTTSWGSKEVARAKD